MSKTYRKDYRPKNKTSKRYTDFDVKYECGYRHNGKSRHADHQRLNQQVRNKEKCQWKKQIDLDI